MENTNLIRRLSERIIHCKNCELCLTRKNAVPGEGPANATIMFIGEAPGRFEDAQGKPFVGKAGKILESALIKANLSRSEVFITNIVKCRPAKNRRPKSKEIRACNDYLNKQISAINPKIICILGATAYSSLLGGKAITANRGKLIKVHGRNYFLTVHPAAVLYRRSLLQVLERDLLKVSRLVLR